MKVLVTGDRAWPPDALYVIRERLALLPADTLVIHGGAPGTDQLAGWVAARRGLAVDVVRAAWDRHGRAAGPIRNREMLDKQPDLVLAFHDDLRRSLGTRDCVTEARRRGIPVELWNTKGERVDVSLLGPADLAP